MFKLACFAAAASSAVASTIPDNDYGYVDVREGAHMFWWLQGKVDIADGAVTPAADRDAAPLVIWLQGGPGGSSTGFGQFKELGPYTQQGEVREQSWATEANLLYIDNPVGTGFSYVDTMDLLTTDNEQISNDLVSLMHGFYEAYPDLADTPLYITCESFGGRMTTGFASALLQAVDAGEIKANLKAVELGDSWIDPSAFTLSWAPFLQAMSLVDEQQAADITAIAAKAAAAVTAGQGSLATQLWGMTEDAVSVASDNVDWYNVLLHSVPDDDAVGLDDDDDDAGGANHGDDAVSIDDDADDAGNYWDDDFWGPPSRKGKKWATRYLETTHPVTLDELMNGAEMREQIGIIPDDVTWGGQANDVFAALSGDFMNDVVNTANSSVSYLLNRDFPVVIANGQLDLICDTLGTEAWIQKLDWAGLDDYNAAKKTPLYTDDTKNTQAFFKESGPLSFYYIMNAGHMLPTDNPDASLLMIQRILSEF